MALNSNRDFPFRPYFEATYPATKSAFNAITLALAIELEETRIKVCAANPSFNATATNNFQGIETVEQGANALFPASLGMNSPTGSLWDQMVSSSGNPLS